MVGVRLFFFWNHHFHSRTTKLECLYFHGFTRRVAILPVEMENLYIALIVKMEKGLKNPTDRTFTGHCKIISYSSYNIIARKGNSLPRCINASAICESQEVILLP